MTDSQNVSTPSADTHISDDDSAAKLAALEQSLLADTEAWMPEPGETLSGTITAIGVRSSEYGEYPALTVRKLDGDELVFHAFRTVALNEIVRQAPKVGDMIAVLYVGGSKDKEYHDYRIRFGTSAGDFDWSRFEEKSKP